MNMNRPLVSIPMLLLIAPGCVKRTESVTILPDGSGLLVTTFHGDPDDVKSGDAWPSRESGWHAAERIAADERGEEKMTLTALRRVAPGTPWPRNYAPARARAQQTALSFPTRIEIERRVDGVYYHFKRVYSGRRFARVAYIRSQIWETDAIKSIRQKDPGQTTREERETLAAALIESEAQKTAAFIDQAAEALGETLAQDAWLHARRRALDVYGDTLLAEQTADIIASDDPGAKFAAMESATRADVTEAIRTTLGRHGIVEGRISDFLDAYELAREDFRVTEDIGDDEIEVTVALPGTIIAHNAPDDAQPRAFKAADAFAEQPDFPQLADTLRGFAAEVAKQPRPAGFQQVRWTWPGQALHDRDVVLMATSFVPARPETGQSPLAR
jgi:hypothetical protein